MYKRYKYRMCTSIMARVKPYTTNQVNWDTILRKVLRIPMNQREYSWEIKEITKFLDDIFKIYEENKYVEKMGSIINLDYNGENDIYDGQQRILTIILILIVIKSFSTKLKPKIDELLSVDSELDFITSEQKKIMDECEGTKLPKIFCINPYDMRALVNIFNNKVQSWIKYAKNSDISDISDDEEDIFCCACCCSKITRKSDFIKHIIKKHKYIPPRTDSKLYEAYTIIYNYLKKKNYSEEKLICLYRFIVNDIDVQFYNCNDPEYVSRIFDWENNRGKDVEDLDIIKNPILVKISDENKLEVYEKWEKLKHKTNRIYNKKFGNKKFGQKIYDIAIQLYNKKIVREVNHEELFKPIINSIDTYKELNKFFEIVEKLFEIMDTISDDRLGRLINNTPRVCLTWEAYMYCILPIFYTINNINVDLIKLITKWYFRNINFNTRTFNNLCYSNEFIKISNNVLKNKNYDYYTAIEKCLRHNKSEMILNENYFQNMKKMNFRSTNATYLLLFLETMINTDLHNVSFDFTLEHIFSKKDKSELKNQSNMDNIGNLTLLEGKNSNNGHKGNSSIGAKKYEKKIESYKGSSSLITRRVAEYFETFEEEQIIERNTEIVKLLNKYTDY